MGTVPLARTFGASETETASYLNTLSLALNFLLAPPRCSLYQAAGTACANNVAQTLLFDTEEYDTDNMHSTVTNTSRITPQTPGLYRVTGQAYLGTNATGQRTLSLMMNGANVKAYDGDGSVPNVWARNISRDLYFNGTTDYVELAVQQASGGSLTTTPGIGNTWLQARWVAVS